MSYDEAGLAGNNLRRFNVTRPRPKKHDLPQSTLDLITEKNLFDVMFYNYAARLFQEAVDKSASQVSCIARKLASNRGGAQGSLGSCAFCAARRWPKGH